MKRNRLYSLVLGMCGASLSAFATCTTPVLWEVAGANSTTSCNTSSPAQIDTTNDNVEFGVYPSPAVTLSGADSSGNCWDSNFSSSATYDAQSGDLLSTNSSLPVRTPPSAWISGGNVASGNLYTTFQSVSSTVCNISTSDTRYFCTLCLAP